MAMDLLLIVLAGFFLPLFPLSMVINTLMARIGNSVVRVLLLFIWPQIGVLLVAASGLRIDLRLFLGWGLFTAIFYAWRLLSVRELGQWAAMLATSAWALAWVLIAAQTPSVMLHTFVFWMTVGPALLVLVAALLHRRLGAAYVGLVTGMARDLPRLAGVLAVVLLVAVALPVFPGFFAMLHLLLGSSLASATIVLLSWLLWSWAATQVLRNTVFGPRSDRVVDDIAPLQAWIFATLIVVAVVSNLIWTGV